MQRIRQLLRSSNPAPSLETRTRDVIVNAPSTFNNVGGHQFNITTNINILPNTSALASTSPASQAPFNDASVDQLSVHFTGRKEVLALIAEAFNKRRHQNIPPRCVLFGNQGVGKSQLTYAWANTTYLRQENSYILWISATTVEKLYQGFSRLLRFIDHPDRANPDESVRLEAARRWLEGVDTGNWLLVLDNVFPETLEFLRQNLPRQNRRGTMLFTTRTQRVALALASTGGERHDVIEVPLLDVKAGVELFCGHFESGAIDPSSEKVEAIVTALGRLPLAISHAAGFMQESHSSLDDMLDLYRSEHKIDAIGWEHTLSDYEHKSVAATFTSQLQDLDRHSPDAGKLLRVMAFFDPESIPLETLITGAKAIVDSHQPPTESPLTASLLALIPSPIARQNAITHLQTRCLVTFRSGSGSPTFHIHDLIQLVVLENTKRSESNEELFELAVELACAAFMQIESVFSHEWWPRCELLVPHIQALTLRQDISNKAKQVLLSANRRRGMYLDTRGRYVEAESLYESIIADRQQFFGPDDLETLAVMNDLAWVYRSRGRYVDAVMLFGQLLEHRKIRLGPEHRDTLKTMYCLADVYYHQQRNDEAEGLLKQTLQGQESQSGSESDDTLWTMNLLASVHTKQKRYDEAESLLKGILQIRMRMVGPEASATLYAKQALVDVYLATRDYDAATVLLQQILRSRERTRGSQHPSTLLAMFCMAVVHSSQGRYKAAESLLVHVLTTREGRLGLSHPDTQSAVKELVLVYEKLGQLDDAEMLRQRISPPAS